MWRSGWRAWAPWSSSSTRVCSFKGRQPADSFPSSGLSGFNPAGLSFISSQVTSTSTFPRGD
ncbi:hypothetical protein EMIT047CA2_50286 [Pseudomonas soli]